MLVGRPSDALVSLGVISANVLVSVVQEIRAKRTLDRIAVLTRPTAQVIRDGSAAQRARRRNWSWAMCCKSGRAIRSCSTARVIGDGQMQVDESQLTGESNLVPKQSGDPVFSGSFCVNGSALYVAEKVGEQSLSNQITAGARAFRRVLTPLQNEIYLVVRIMLAIVIYIEFLLVIDAWSRAPIRAKPSPAPRSSSGLVPNGLFLSITLAYALGAVRIIQYGALVQQSNAIESLSNVTVLCLDKTGTLTANRLQVNAVHPIGIERGRTASTCSARWSPAPRRSTRPAKRSSRRIPPTPARCWPMCPFRRRASGAPWRSTHARHLRDGRAGDAAALSG